MVTTRKKARISYQEEYKSDEEVAPVASTSTNAGPPPAFTSTVKKKPVDPDPEAEEAKPDDDDFVLTGRNYLKKGKKRKMARMGPKKPVFDHSRILELPADVLCTILSHVPLENLFYLSISSKKLGSFLQSKTSASIWIEARKRLTVYAPKNFLNSSMRDYTTPPPRDPLQHYEFRRLPLSDGSIQAQQQAEMDAFEDEEAKLPLAVPSPPAGVSEFAVVRYLFCNICYHCGKEGRGTMIKVPELLAHFCKPCWTTQTGLFKNVLSIHEGNLTPEQFIEIPDYTQFLLTLPAWKQTARKPHLQFLQFSRQGDEINDDRDQPLRPKDRRIYTGDLESRHEEYKAKKASLPKEEFDAWVVKTIKDHEEARRQVGSLSEYLWLKNTFNRYQPRVREEVRERNEKAIREAILDRLVGDLQCDRSEAETMLKHHSSLYVRLSTTTRVLEEEAWEKIKPQAEEYMKAYERWVAANPLMRYSESAQAVISYCTGLIASRRVTLLTNNMKLDSAHFLSLPKIKDFLLEQPSEMTLQERRQWARDKTSDLGDALESDLVAVCNTIKKDLVRKLLLKDGKSVAKLDSWSNAKLHEMLDKPDVWFECTSCKTARNTFSWLDIAAHACTANEKGERNYGNRRIGYPDAACIPVGWKSDSVEFAGSFKGLYNVLEAAARAKQEESGLSTATNPFRFPSSHSAIALDQRWKFKCILGVCWTGYTRLADIMPHLANHIADGKTTLRQLGEEHQPSITVPYSVSYNHPAMGYGMDSDEFDSDFPYDDY